MEVAAHHEFEAAHRALSDVGVEALTNYPLAAVAVEASPGIGALSLAASPNPMRPQERLTVRFGYHSLVPARISIHAADGRLVRGASVVAGASGSDGYAGTWNWDGIDEAGRATPAGVYFVTLRAGPVQASTRFVRLGH